VKPRKKKQPSSSLNLYAFSDEELLALVKDNLDQEGWVTSAELADAIGLDPEDDNRSHCVAQRLSWMVRFGVVQKDKEKVPARWTITGRGIVILEATFSADLQAALAKMKGDALWRLARDVTTRYGQADQASAVMVRRSFQRAHKLRSNGS